MRFANPYWIFLIFVFLSFVVFLIWAYWARQRVCERFAQRDLLQSLLIQVDWTKKKLKIVLLAAGIFFCLLALSRPQWGFKWQEVKRRGLDIVVALDVSRSMLAADIKPSRLERAKLALRDFVKDLKGDRIGLVAFSGSAFLACPLTIDYGGFLLSLEGLGIDSIPRGGTAIGEAIKVALRSFSSGEGKHKALIIITDGEDHKGDSEKFAEEAKKEGIVIFCIGIGTSGGELIFVEGPDGGKEFLKDDQGNAVKTRLNEDILQKIALATGGAYVRSLPTEFGLELLYRQKLSAMEKRESQGKMARRYVERFQIPLLIGLALILIEAVLSERKKR